MVETARELELDVVPDDESQDQTCTEEELLLMAEQGPWFLEMGSAPGDDADKIVEMATKGSEYHTHFAGKAAAGSEKTNVEKVYCG